MEKLKTNTNEELEHTSNGLEVYDFDSAANFETKREKTSRGIGEVAVKSMVRLEGSPGFESIKSIDLLERNLGALNLSPEDSQKALDLLERSDEDSVYARYTIESVLSDGLVIDFIQGHSDLAQDTKRGVVDIINNIDDTDYRWRIEEVGSFMSNTSQDYAEARESGYPADLLIDDRLRVFSRYAHNNLPIDMNSSVADYLSEKSKFNLQVAKDIGFGAGALYEVDKDIAKSLLQNEAYNRRSENYDALTSESCEEIALGVDRIKLHGTDRSEDILGALRRNMGSGYENNTYMVNFANEILEDENVARIIESDVYINGFEYVLNDELNRLEWPDEVNGFESIKPGLDSLSDWLEVSGHIDDQEITPYILNRMSKSSRPQQLIDNFRSLDFIEDLNSDLQSQSEQSAKSGMIRDIFNSSMLEFNPDVVNESYLLYSKQEVKFPEDFREVIQMKESLSRNYIYLQEGNRSEVQDHFEENYLKYINRVDKDGNRFDSARSIHDAVRDSYREYGSNEGVNPDSLKWFEDSSKLPMFAYQSVVRMRTEALSSGVNDNPDDVYDFIYNNPENIRRSSEINRDQYIRSGLIKKYDFRPNLPGMDVSRVSDDEKFNQLKVRAMRDVEARSDSFRTFVNISEEALKSVAGQGMQLKSYLDADVEKDYGGHYNSRRSGVEIGLGIRSMSDDDLHPVYGSAGFIDNGVPAGAFGYGEIMLVFDDNEINERSTYTSEDSFHGANRLTREDAMTVRAAKDICSIGHSLTSDYVEVQVSGGIDINKLESICVEDRETAESIKQFLSEDMHSKIIVRPIDKSAVR